jgi:phosphotriesterase-related protein
LAAAAKSSGVTVIATTGFHKASYYAATHWANMYPLSALAELVRADVTEGIDRYDYAGPRVERTGVRAGIVKAGADYNRFAGRERDLHRVAAEVALDTGVPLLLHVEHGADPHQQLDVVTAAGLAPHRVLVSHLDRNPDPDLHLSVARRGAYIVYDGLYRERYRPQSALVDLFARIADGMCLDRLLVGADLALRAYRRATGAPGIAGLYTRLVPRLRERLGAGAAEQILTHNARRALAMTDHEPQEQQ